MITGKKIKMRIKKTKKDKEVTVLAVYVFLRENTVSLHIFLIVVFYGIVDLAVRGCELDIALNVGMMAYEKSEFIFLAGFML